MPPSEGDRVGVRYADYKYLSGEPSLSSVSAPSTVCGPTVIAETPGTERETGSCSSREGCLHRRVFLDGCPYRCQEDIGTIDPRLAARNRKTYKRCTDLQTLSKFLVGKFFHCCISFRLEEALLNIFGRRSPVGSVQLMFAHPLIRRCLDWICPAHA